MIYVSTARHVRAAQRHYMFGSATVSADRQGSGVVHLPAAFIEANDVAYGQPILLDIKLGGRQHTCLCSASVSTLYFPDIQFDPSVECGLVDHPALLPQQQLQVSVTAVTTKVVTAASVKVLVPEVLLLSAVPAAKLQQRLVQKGCTLHLASGVSCQVLDVSPAAASNAVYRVVPSTAIQLTADRPGNQLTPQPASATAEAEPPTAKLDSNRNSSSSSSRPRSSGSSSSSKKKACSSSGVKQSKPPNKAGSSSSKDTTANRPAGDTTGSESPVAAGGSMFDLLNALEDD